LGGDIGKGAVLVIVEKGRGSVLQSNRYVIPAIAIKIECRNARTVSIGLNAGTEGNINKAKRLRTA